MSANAAEISVMAPGTIQSTAVASISASAGATNLFPDNKSRRGKSLNYPAELQMEDEEADENDAQDFNNNEEMITDQQCNLGDSTLQPVHISQSHMIDTNMVLSDFSMMHPSLHLSRATTNDIQRQNINVRDEYGESIMTYMRELEK